jgi:dihydroneopterin aldolase
MSVSLKRLIRILRIGGSTIRPFPSLSVPERNMPSICAELWRGGVSSSRLVFISANRRRVALRLAAPLKAITMPRQAKIELRDLHLPVSIGTYGSGDVVPDAHVLDLDLTISPDLVQVASDDMANVFDYDPLIAEIAVIAQSQTFETQEYLMTLITKACAAYSEILAVEICLRKSPVLAETGSLGVRLILGAEDLAALRHHKG